MRTSFCDGDEIGVAVLLTLGVGDTGARYARYRCTIQVLLSRCMKLLPKMVGQDVIVTRHTSKKKYDRLPLHTESDNGS